MVAKTPKIFNDTHARHFIKCVAKEFFTPEVMDIVVGLHVHFQDYKKMSKWLQTKNLNFGGYTPLELISLGRGKKVQQFIDNAYETGDPI